MMKTLMDALIADLKTSISVAVAGGWSAIMDRKW